LRAASRPFGPTKTTSASLPARSGMPIRLKNSSSVSTGGSVGVSATFRR
jgi:hypothetical protein